ncbi:MAG: hypothetical protein AB7G87_03910 [Clostridia bacterium]
MRLNKILIAIIIILLLLLIGLYSIVFSTPNTKSSTAQVNSINPILPRMHFRLIKDSFFALSSDAYDKMSAYIDQHNSAALIEMVDQNLIVPVEALNIEGTVLEKYDNGAVKVKYRYNREDPKSLKRYDKVEGYLPVEAIELTSIPSDIDIKFVKSLESIFNTQLYQISGYANGSWINNQFEKDSVYKIQYYPRQGIIVIFIPIDSNTDFTPINNYLSYLFPQSDSILNEISQSLVNIVEQSLYRRSNFQLEKSISGHKIIVSSGYDEDYGLEIKIDLLGENKNDVYKILNNQ